LQEAYADQVHDEADRRDRQHGAAGDRRRVSEALIRFEDDVHGHAEEHDRVGQGGQDFDPVVAIGALGRRRSLPRT
jgi:hypothetical protein